MVAIADKLKAFNKFIKFFSVANENATLAFMKNMACPDWQRQQSATRDVVLIYEVRSRVISRGQSS